MRIVILNVQVPFTTGGAEALAASLAEALRARGHEVDTLSIPFRWYPPEIILDHMLANRLLNVDEANGTAIDLAIGLKFPAYLIPHPNKTLWIVHQFRQAYDLIGTAFGELYASPLGSQVCDAVRQADRACFTEARRIFTTTRTVSDRLLGFCGVSAEPLYHPPPKAQEFYRGEDRSYFYFPSRVNALKRQGLILEALAQCSKDTHVVFSGVEEDVQGTIQLKEMACRLGIEGQVTWRGWVSDEEKLALFADCRAVLFPAWDEDYGYVTLEAMLSGKAVVTCRDSGGAREFVEDGETGFVTEPSPEALAEALGRLQHKPDLAVRMGCSGRAVVRKLDLTWSNVVDRLVG